MTLPPKPTAIEVWSRNIPQALKDIDGWLMWKWWWDDRHQKWTKPPYNIDGIKIDEGNPKNWVDFSTALQTYQKGGFDGIGISMNALDTLAGVDLDHCIDNGKIAPWAEEIVRQLGSYAEVSPSGTGLRVFGFGHIESENGRKKGDIEMYHEGRYLTATGHHLDISPFDVVDFNEALNALHDQVWGEDQEVKGQPDHRPDEIGDDLAERFAALCEDDPIFKDKYYSPASVGDRSDIEFNLCAKLYEEGFSASEIRSLMDSSPQEKWRERGADDYRDTTIRNAIASAGARKETVLLTAEELKEDPDKLVDPRVIRGLHRLRKTNRLKFETLLKKASIRGGQREALIEELDKIDFEREQQREKDEDKKAEISESDKKKVWDLLTSGKLIDSIITTTSRKMKGGEDLRRLEVLSGVTAYNDGPKLHLAAVGEPQTGKTAQGDAVIESFPEEDVITLTDVSPQAFYYMSKKINFDKKIVRIDDAREVHIPVVKVLEDDSPTPALKFTVIDGEGVDLKIQGKPVLWTTSVGPLVDRSGQTVSRSLMISPDGATDEEAADIKAKIWETEQFGTAKEDKDDEDRRIHRIAFRVLREGGAGTVLIPFKVKPPENCSRRGTKQFATLIKSLAFINQFQRVRFYLNGKRYILADYKDFEEAARLWFAFFDLQTHKSGGKWVRDILVCLKTYAPKLEEGRDDPDCRTPKEISDISGFPVRTVNNYLKDLYEAGIINRAEIKAPGSPYAYWISAKYANAEIPATGEVQTELGELGKKTGLPKYLEENQLQGPSISIYIYQLGKGADEWGVELNSVVGVRMGKSSREKILSLYQENSCLIAEMEENEAEDSDLNQADLGKAVLPNLPEYPPAIENPETKDFRLIQPAPKEEVNEALSIVEGLGEKRVTFGNVEAYLESKNGGYVEPKEVKRVLDTLSAVGWKTGKDGVMVAG